MFFLYLLGTVAVLALLFFVFVLGYVMAERRVQEAAASRMPYKFAGRPQPVQIVFVYFNPGDDQK